MARVHLHKLGYFYINESRALRTPRGMKPDLICPLCGMPLHKYKAKLSPVTYHHIDPLAEDKTNKQNDVIVLTEPHQCMLHSQEYVKAYHDKAKARSLKRGNTIIERFKACR